MKKISVIIPVLKEPAINEAIENIQSQNYDNCEIIVVDGDDSGSTIKHIKDDSIIKLISSKGRARQMNFGAERSSGDILLFLHADSRLPERGLEKVEKIIKSGFKIGCFDIHFDSKCYLLREIISRTSSLRGRLTRLPYGDQAFFFLRNSFQQIGGFPEIPLMEDIAIMQKVKRSGEKIFIIPDKISTSDRRWQQEGLFYVMLRNPILSTLYLLGVTPDKLTRFYL